MTFRCDAVLFDMDGTLVDSRIACENLLRAWAVRHGLNAELISAAAQGRTNRDIAREFTPHLTAEEEGARLDQEELFYREGNVAVRGAVDLVSALPVGSWALVTSASRQVAEMRLECAGLPVPAILISSDDVRRGKPDPEGYLMAAGQLGVKPERCLVIEDTPAGLEAARRAGMNVLGITTTFRASDLGATTCIADFTRLEVGQIEASGEPRFELCVTPGARI
jgi:mannitol-1-/sugar-/sorbitol-6-phosphatase